MSSRRVVKTMGTVFSVLAPACPDETLDQVEAEWRRIDGAYSPYLPGSLTSQVARGDIGPHQAGPEMALIARRCQELNVRTGGLFDAFASGTFDPCGYVKGWAIARGAQLIRAAGANSVLVNGGGDVQAHGRTPDGLAWRIGVAHPRRPGRLAFIVHSPDGGPLAVATSGTYERGAHVISQVGCALSVTVVGRDIAEADAAATAALAAGDGARDLIESWDGLDALGFARTGTVWWTEGMRRYGPLPSLARAS